MARYSGAGPRRGMGGTATSSLSSPSPSRRSRLTPARCPPGWCSAYSTAPFDALSSRAGWLCRCCRPAPSAAGDFCQSANV